MCARRTGARVGLAAAAGLCLAIWLSWLVPPVPPAVAAPPILPAWSGSLSPSAPVTMDKFVYLPLIQGGTAACQQVPGTFSVLGVNPPPTDRPADVHADLNLGWRGYTPTTGYLGLVDIGGPTDGGAPQFPGLFGDNRTPSFTSGFKVYNWSWVCNCRTTPIASPVITLIGLGTANGEAIRVPPSGYEIGSGFEVLVLYADESRITLKYTREDNVIAGYTIHLERVCTDPRLLALYRQWNAAGRGQLPALTAGQAFGRATGGEVLASIQDSGMWMDPRSRKDWWKGR